MDEFKTKSAFGLAQDIKSKKISSAELTEHCIREISRWNPKVNAMVEDRFETARAEAKTCDDLLAANPGAQTPPLFGVPATVKEMIALEGFRCTVGTVNRRNFRSTKDSTVVQRMKKAGCVILGTTNVPEMGLWFESNNPVYGDTKNPYNLKRTAGGSSGGEAALIGAGASPIGIGSDIGGSLRIPASFCGIFSHKPSEKWIPLTGQFPYFQDEIVNCRDSFYPFTVIGPMTRSAFDLEPFFKILAGRDDFDAEATDRIFNSEPVCWKGRKVFTLASPKILGCFFSADEEVQQATLTAAKHFEKLGAEIVELPRDLFEDAFQLWTARSLTVERKKYVELLANGADFKLGRELLRWGKDRVLGRRPDYQMTSLLTVLAEAVSGDQKKLIAKKEKQRLELKNKMAELFGHENILLMPPHPRNAPKVGSTILRPFDYLYTAVFNALGLPVSSVPMGIGKDGLPLAVQIVANTDQDHLCLRAAEELERAFGGWQPPVSI